MIIKSLELENFRQYKGKQPELKLYLNDKEKNVTIFLGDNTSGKTTLLQSFLWCLYGYVNFQSKDELLNKDTEYEVQTGKLKSADVSVKMVVDYLGSEYTISRKRTYTIQGKNVSCNNGEEFTVWKKSENGDLNSIVRKNAENLVQEMFPKDLSDYFFYDTERFKNITSKKEVNNSVRGLLGLTSLENMIDHIGRKDLSSSVLGQLHSELDIGTEPKYTELIETNNQLQNKIQESSKDKEQIMEQIQKYEIEIKDIREKLTRMDKVSELERQRIQLENELKTLNFDLENKRQRFKKQINNNTYAFFAAPLITKAKDLLADKEFDNVGIKDMNANSIDHILERGVCICGVEIEKHSREEQALLREKEFLPPKSIGMMIQQFKERTDNFLLNSSNFVEDINVVKEDIAKIELEIDRIDDELDQISQKIKSNSDSRTLEETLTKFERYKDDKIQSLGKINAKIEGRQKLIDRNINIIETLAIKNHKNNELYEKIAYLNEVLAWAKKSFEKREEEINESLQVKINDAFQKIYHGNRLVKIDEKYNVSLIVEGPGGNKKVDTSEGLETVKNFSFLAGLVGLAIEKRAEDLKTDAGSEIEPLPLVIDAPFSNTDSRHVSKIAEVLPSVAEQLILIVMQKDFDHAINSMADSIGIQYQIEKISETHTVIKEVAL